MPDPNIRQTKTSTGPIGSPVREFKNMRRNVTATAGEVREFMGKLRGKNASEMLGVVASSSLVQSIVTATLVFGILIVALTVVPYTWGMIFGEEKAAVEEASGGGAESGSGEGGDTGTEPSGETDPEGTGTPASDPEGGETVTPPAGAADVLGIGEEKPAPPGSNPLEGAVDDLFEDVK